MTYYQTQVELFPEISELQLSLHYRLKLVHNSGLEEELWRLTRYVDDDWIRT
jgi:hypothetical protein